VIVVDAQTSSRSYRITVGHGLLTSLDGLWEGVIAPRRVVVCCDATVAALYLDPVRESLAAAGLDVIALVIPPGEGEKSPQRLALIYDRLYDESITRTDAVVSLGGGVVGDLAGYAAATYLRGVRFVQVPTTLLAMVDASVGGKVAVDFRSGKNHIGTFYQPWLVVADLDTLRTLPDAEMRSGGAEVVKYALLGGGALLERVERYAGSGVLPDEEIVATCVREKVTVVARDEREESGARALLNLGHTVGHAIEAATGFEGYSHGQAVGLGLRAMLWLSERCTGLDRAAAARGQRLLTSMGLPERLEDVSTDDVVGLISRDKKAVGGGVKYVLLRELGVPAPRETVAPGLEREVVEWLAHR
jgi:3-dehydroquinate synthase